MTNHFDLIITADYPRRIAEFTLRDSSGVQLGYRQTDFKAISVSHQRGLFDLRNHLRLYVEEGKQRAAVAEIGVCIAEEVLGKEIFAALYAAKSQRTLRIQLPDAGDTENHLAAALARVPWEIARPKPEADTLGERNLLVRVVHDMQAPASTPIELAADESLRVLFVFAESRDSPPLGARKERRELLRLFGKEIYPNRRVIAHFLTHGVTRERLSAQIQEHDGYHIVHWSGHGHRNLLELCKPGGEKDLLSGSELLDLFLDAGGFLPRLFFLSACHSGDILRVKDWNDFLAVAQGKELGTKAVDTRDLDLKEQPGYTGTAHALLQGGVPSVVAMRYAVGDDYARELAVQFYRAQLAHAQPKNVAAALTMARQAMLDGNKHDSSRLSVCDHATPVFYGEELVPMTPDQLKRIIAEGEPDWAITNLGALLFAKKLESFDRLARKAPRVIVYEGTNKLKTKSDKPGSKGYAVGFQGLVEFINGLVPSNEVIEQALRREVKMFPEIAVRELVANALIHQDFNETGTSVMVEIYSDRMEISNPGKPFISPDRFIDEYQSRNERLADLMRRLGICEEKGSGVDKVIQAAEAFQLPAPDFRVGEKRTSVVLFGHKDFEDMDRNDRIRATYQHCCLRYVMNEKMTNQSLRERFRLSEKKTESVSRAIRDAVDAGKIKLADPEQTSLRYRNYVPFWA